MRVPQAECAQQSTYQSGCSGYAVNGGNAIPPEPPALHVVAMRLENLVADLGNARDRLQGFTSRVLGPILCDTSPNKPPCPSETMGTIGERLDQLSRIEADFRDILARVERIG